MLSTLYHIFCDVLFIYLAGSAGYLLFFALLGTWGRRVIYRSHPEKLRMAILIPAYREDAIICDTAERVYGQSYPRTNYQVTVIADSLAAATLDRLKKIPVNVIMVSFEKSTKSKALKAAMLTLSPEQFDLVVILDADNVMSSDCLEKINHAFHCGFSVVQMHRTAKNRNTPVAVLEAASEEINNHIFRKGQRVAGLSAALIGSGMAFRFSYFRNLLETNDLDHIPGEDREIELILLRDRLRVEYLDDALVLDEKVQDNRILENQRSRWLGAQLQYLHRFFYTDVSKLLQFRMNYWNKVLQTAILPRVLLLGLLILMALVALFCHLLHQELTPGNWYWAGLAFIYVMTLGISVPAAMYDRKLLLALFYLPRSGFALVRALIKTKAGRGEFIHTPKGFTNQDPPA